MLGSAHGGASNPLFARTVEARAKVTENGASSRDFSDFKSVSPHGMNP